MSSKIFCALDKSFIPSISTPQSSSLHTPSVLDPFPSSINHQDISADFSTSFTPPVSSLPNPDIAPILPPGICTRTSTRIIKTPKKYDDFLITKPHLKPSIPSSDISASFNVFLEPTLSHMSSSHLHSLSNMLMAFEPSTYHQAKDYPEWVAVQKQLNALEQNQTWDTILPPDKKAIGSKWVFKTKFNPDGSVERCKARLVARGDKQVLGKDFKHTFSHVAKFSTVRIIIALAATRNWDIQQLDINNAFLHGFLDEEIYMTPPQGYSKAPPGYVCKLKRSLYGLRQVSRCWNIELSKHLISLGFL